MQKQLLTIPKFKNEDEEFAFWSSHDTTDYVDWSNAELLSFPNLKPTENIDQKLKQLLIMRDLERLAEKKHISKEALILKYLSEGLRREGASA